MSCRRFLSIPRRALCEESSLRSCFEWLVEHAADILTKYPVGKDGRTPYERVKKKKYGGEMFEFGSVVLVKLQGKLHGGLMRERWVRAIWLGKRWSSDEHVVSLASGKVVRARDARPEPDDRAFDLVLFKSVKGTPSNPAAADDGEDVLRDVQRAPVQRPQEPVAASIPRGVIIHRSYLEKFGYTNTCAKCRAILQKDRSQPT